MKDEILAGLDIGSTSIRLVVGQRSRDVDGEVLQVIGAVSAPAFGVSKGSINSIEDATSSITACLEKAERLVGVPIKTAFVSLNNPKIRCDKSRGVAIVSKSDGEIDENDVERAVEASKALAIPNNYEIIHVVPMKFTIDNQEDIKDPVGMSGIRLEVETLIIMALSNQLKNLTKAVYRTGLNIDDLVLSPLAVAEAVATPKQKDLGIAVINLGATTTGVSVFEEGNLIHCAVLPVGSDHITNDIALGLRCPINLAERIKLEFGSANSNNFSKKDEIDVSDLAKSENVNDNFDLISQKYLSEIIEARVEEIFEMVDQELKKVERSGMLPAGAILAGAPIALDGLADIAKNKLRLPVSLAEAKKIRFAIDKARQPEFITALGLLSWGFSYSGQSSSSRLMDFGGAFSKIKGFFQKIMPKD